MGCAEGMSLGGDVGTVEGRAEPLGSVLGAAEGDADGLASTFASVTILTTPTPPATLASSAVWTLAAVRTAARGPARSSAAPTKPPTAKNGDDTPCVVLTVSLVGPPCNRRPLSEPPSTGEFSTGAPSTAVTAAATLQAATTSGHDGRAACAIPASTWPRNAGAVTFTSASVSSLVTVHSTGGNKVARPTPGERSSIRPDFAAPRTSHRPTSEGRAPARRNPAAMPATSRGGGVNAGEENQGEYQRSISVKPPTNKEVVKTRRTTRRGAHVDWQSSCPFSGLLQ